MKFNTFYDHGANPIKSLQPRGNVKEVLKISMWPIKISE